MFSLMGRNIAGLLSALMLTACASQSDADNIYINTSISGELMPGVYGQVNIGNVPDYVMVYDQPVIIAQQPAYIELEPIYLYVPPYHAYHWRESCQYYNACARPVYFICANDYRQDYFEPRYYNSRVYEPPRVYRHGHSHIRPTETLYQREMNHDSHYPRINNNEQPPQHSGGRVHFNNDNRNNNYRDNNRDQQRDERPDNRGHDSRGNDYRTNDSHNNDHRNDKRDDRQQFINGYRDDGSQTPASIPRQQGPRQQYPQRNDSGSSTIWQNNAVRIQNTNQQRSYSTPRPRVEMPTRQPNSPQPKFERASVNSTSSNGRDDRRRDDDRKNR